MVSKGLQLVLWLGAIHVVGIYLFTRGFLLTRLSLDHTATCSDGSCTLPASHSRLVFLVIDALRFDFVTPDPPKPADPYYHNVLTLPAELTRKHPERSLLFTSFADPPTTTLQRIKGLTAGSLPTFVDIGSNFGGYAVTEDSWIGQLKAAGKKIAFMGDDTWTTVFPDSFDPHLTFPYDSFNVEDLHTVDAGVTKHILPLLAAAHPSPPPVPISNSSFVPPPGSGDWDVLIAHMLGVDHIGHRTGPSHPTMRAKLQQINTLLEHTIALLPKDTLLVVIGDHGMDRRGDHGGDSYMETTAGVWFYSNGEALIHPDAKSKIPEQLLEKDTFPGASVAHRHIEQVDLVPTFSLALGLPIPFTSLGRIIPEVVWGPLPSSARFETALDLNAKQLRRYLEAYRDSGHGGELESVWDSLRTLWENGLSKSASEASIAQNMFIRETLRSCRALWARFNLPLMLMGLIILSLGLFSTWIIWLSLKDPIYALAWEQRAQGWFTLAAFGAITGSVLGLIIAPMRWVDLGINLGPLSLDGVSSFQLTLFLSAFISTLSLLPATRPLSFIRPYLNLKPETLKAIHYKLPTILGVVPLILHSLTPLSNSYTVWESYILTFLLLSTLIPHFLAGLSAPSAALRNQILANLAVFVVSARLMASVGVCREEQGAFCTTTFYTAGGVTGEEGEGTQVPRWSVFAVVPVALGALPFVVNAYLKRIYPDGLNGAGKKVVGVVLPCVWGASSLAWVLEYLDSAGVLDGWTQDAEKWKGLVRSVRTLLAWGSLTGICAGGWLIRGEKKQASSTQATPLVPALLFLSGIAYPFAQPPAQLTLALSVVTILSYTYLLSALRESRQLERLFTTNPSLLFSSPTSTSSTPEIDVNNLRFIDTAPLAFLAQHIFYSTGHQPTIPSLQWKAAFVLTKSVRYPWSVLGVVGNTWGAGMWVVCAAVGVGAGVGVWKGASGSGALKDLEELLAAVGNAEEEKGTQKEGGKGRSKGKAKTAATKEQVAKKVQATQNSEKVDQKTLDQSQPRDQLHALPVLLTALPILLHLAAPLLTSSLSCFVLRRHLMVWKIFAPRWMYAVGGFLCLGIGVLAGASGAQTAGEEKKKAD